MRGPARAWPAALLAAAAIAVTLSAPSPARAAEYTMTTAATYRADPTGRVVEVSIQVEFENTTPDPEGRFSVFEVIDLAVQDGAAEVTARDAAGSLNVSVGDRDGHTLVSVRPRTGVRYGQEMAFTVAYRLPDGASPQVRVRPAVIAFPVWSFGTSGRVQVNLPDDYEVTVSGDDLTAEREGSSWLLSSGPVDDPASWQAQLSAVGPATYTTFSRAVPLSSGTVDLQVRSWADDEAWGERTLELVAGALPRLEELIGLPYPDVGPLVVVETVSAPEDELSEPSSEGTRLLAGYDQPAFTLLHQTAHVWISDRLAAQRWIREGFASWAAERLAPALDVDLPYDPAERRAQLDDDAFPLVSWGAGAASPEQEAYAYAAAWEAARRIGSAVGEEALREAWRRVEAGIGPYDVAEPAPGADRPAAVDARGLLDQLGTVSDADLATIFAELVFDPDAAADLGQRERARTAYAALLEAAGEWGAPEPVRADMTAWRFERAEERMREARAWLADRDRLLADAQRVGLTVPDRLRDRYLTSGGASDARAELDAQAAVVASYDEALARSTAERGLLERLGLLGGPDPADLLSQANALFAEGELREAAQRIEATRARLDGAATDGAVRLAAGGLALLVLPVMGIRLLGRRRGRSVTDYTAAA